MSGLDPIENGDRVIIEKSHGMTVIAAAAPIESGDAVIIKTDSSGKKMMFKAGGGGGGEEVDPCKSLTIGLNPDNWDQLLITWEPGDNNTAVHYEYAVDVNPTTINSGDIHRTILVGTTTRSENILEYYAWHYVCIWGMKGTRYSSTYLQAAIVTVPPALMAKFKAYITRPANSGLPKITAAPFVEYGPAGNEIEDVGTIEFSWDGEAGTIMVSGSPSANVSTWVDDVIAAEQMLGAKSGQTGDFGTNASLNSVCNIGENMLRLQAKNTVPVVWSWGTLTNGHYPWKVYKQNQPYLIQDGGNAPHGASSWWLEGDSDNIPAEPYSSSVSVKTPWNGGLAYAAVTIYFSDGLGYTGYIAFTVTDLDDGLIHIWASLPAGGRPKELWAGDTMICSNIDGPLTYDGYLTISLLD